MAKLPAPLSQEGILKIIDKHKSKGAQVTVQKDKGFITEVTVDYNLAPINTSPPYYKAHEEFKESLPLPQSALEVLELAEKAIDELGWIKGSLEGPGGVCMLGAIEMVNGKYKHSEQASRALVDAIKNNMGWRSEGWTHSIPSFNDEEDTTLEDVKLAFKHARHNLENS